MSQTDGAVFDARGIKLVTAYRAEPSGLLARARALAGTGRAGAGERPTHQPVMLPWHPFR